MIKALVSRVFHVAAVSLQRALNTYRTAAALLRAKRRIFLTSKLLRKDGALMLIFSSTHPRICHLQSNCPSSKCQETYLTKPF